MRDKKEDSNLETHINSRKTYKIKHFFDLLYGYLFLLDFNKKTPVQCFFSVLFNIIFGLISLTGIVPIIDSFIPTHPFELSYYFVSSFVLCFVYFINVLLRMFYLKRIYKMSSYIVALKKQIFHISGYLQLLTFCTTIGLLSFFGEFNANGIVIKEIEHEHFCMVCISILFLLNTITSIGRFVSMSKSKNDFSILKSILLSKVKTLFIFIVILLVVVIMFGFVIFSIERIDNNQTKFKSIFDAIYFVIVTITTVGYGDLVATKELSRAIVIILIIIGIFIYAFLSSQFIDIFNEYIKTKKRMSYEVSENKRREYENNHLLSEIDKLIVKNLYESKLITKRKFNKMIERINASKTSYDSYEYNEQDFSYDYKTKTIYFKKEPLGIFVNDPIAIEHAESVQWAINYYNNSLTETDTLLYYLTMRIANKFTSDSSMQIIFTRKNIPNNIKRLIIYQKKPYLSAIAEVEVAAINRLETSYAWKKYCHFTDLSYSKYNSIFKKQKQISIILIKNIIAYKEPKVLEKYGMKEDLVLKDIMPLI